MSPIDRSNPRSDKDIFFEALDISTPQDRHVFLNSVCAGDPEKRRRLEELLANHFHQEGFMEAPAAMQDSRESLIDSPLNDDSGRIIDRYKLLEKLGEGGFGVVYVAEQREPVKRRVALKIIKLGMDTRQVVARFEAERQALAMMDHPNIAKVHDAGATETGRPYFVMELVRGVRITEYCNENNLSIEERLKLFTRVCQAIQHAHQKGIIHRDIKPSNILITSHDGVPVPKVIDFGIAKAIEADLTEKTVYTQFHQFIGTPAYMSPEQAEMSGLDVDTRTDIYALGVLLYELLTGQTPFDGKELLQSGLDQMRKTIREKEPVRPSTRLRQTMAATRTKTTAPLRSTLSSDLDWIVMKCLEKDRTRRYETANGLFRDIQRHLDHEPVSARAPTAIYKVRKFARRNRATVATIGAIALFLIAGIAVSTWQAVIATRARGDALRAKEQETQQRLRADGEKRLAERNLYIANMTLAQHAWEENLYVGVRQLLEETATYPNRSFEWHYLHRQLNTQVRTLRGHRETVDAVAYSPDGHRIVTASGDGTAKIWQADTGAELLTLRGHAAQVNCVAFSPDGNRIATGSLDRTARVWDAQTGNELFVFQGETGRFWSVEFSADSQRILSSSDDFSAHLWEAETGKSLLRIGEPLLTKASFSPDFQRIVAGGRHIKIWNSVSGTELSVVPEPGAWVAALAWSPDGRRIVAGLDGSVKVFDAETANQLLFLHGHRGPVFSAAYSPDSQQLVTGGADGIIKFWEAATAKELFTIYGNNGGVRDVAFSPDGRHIVTASEDGSARIWRADKSSAGEPLAFNPHGAFIYSAHFSANGKQILTSSHDSTARLWDAETGDELMVFKGHSTELSSALFFPDNKRVVTISVDQTARIWETATGRELFTFRGHSAPIYAAAISPDGKRVITCSAPGGWAEAENLTGKVWDAATGNELLTLTGLGRWVAFSPDGRRIASGAGGYVNVTRILDSTTGEELLRLKGHAGPVAFSPDGRRIVTAGEDKTAKIWDAQSGALLATLHGHTGFINSVAFSKDGQRIATASVDQTARLWDVDTGKEMLALRGHTAQVSSAVFSPDDQRIVSAGWDGARIWQAASPEQVASVRAAK